MNYIEQINNFWAYSEELEISSSEISVYFALLKYNNSLNWIESFRCDYAIICQYANVSKNTFYKSINSLSNLELIKYEKGERNVLKPKISILKLKNKKGTIREQNEEQYQEQKGEQHCEQKGNLYKLLNKETIKLLNLETQKVAEFLNNNILNILDKELTKDQIVYPFESKEFLEVWNQWKIYRKEQHKFTYKTLSTEQAALMELTRKASSENEAIKVILQSIGNGWKGFYEMKAGTKHKNGNGVTTDELKELFVKHFK